MLSSARLPHKPKTRASINLDYCTSQASEYLGSFSALEAPQINIITDIVIEVTFSVHYIWMQYLALTVVEIG